MKIIEDIKAYSTILKGKIKPDYNLKSIFDIDIDELQKKGIKGVFFDLDSTLTISKSAKFSKEARKLIYDFESRGMKLAIISNNYSDKYINKVQKEIHLKIYYPAQKPQTKMIFKALDDFGLKPDEVAMVGDRPLTDILAGKNAGMMTILVDGIDAEHENLPTRLIRRIERLSLNE